MEIKSEQQGKALVVMVQERRLEAANATYFKSALVDFMNGGATRIILDLSKVEFIDSSGLGSIVSILKTLGDEGELILCGINKPVMSLFRLTRLDRIFRIFPTADEAVESLPES